MCIRDSSYAALVRLLGREFRGLNDRVSKRKDVGENEAIASVRETAVSYTHLDVYKRQLLMKLIMKLIVFILMVKAMLLKLRLSVLLLMLVILLVENLLLTIPTMIL